MLQRLSKTFQKNWIQQSLKVFLLLGLCFVIYLQIKGNSQQIPWQDLSLFWQNQFGLVQWLALVTVLLLMPLNWALETQKWVQLMKPIEKISFGKAFKAVLAGLSVSMFTPNRIGEYGGRLLLVSPPNRLASVFATLVGSISQWIVLVFGGFIAVIILLAIGLFNTASLPIIGPIFAIAGLASLAAIWIYFNLSSFAQKAAKWRYTQKWAKKIQENLFQHYSNAELFQALKLSALRYLVYSLQYCCLLVCFGFQLNFGHCFLAVLFIFMLQTGLPIPPSVGLVARGSIALWVFVGLLGSSSGTELSVKTIVLAATFSLWLINVLIPACFGGLFIAQLGWKKAQVAEENSDEELALSVNRES